MAKKKEKKNMIVTSAIRQCAVKVTMRFNVDLSQNILPERKKNKGTPKNVKHDMVDHHSVAANIANCLSMT